MDLLVKGKVDLLVLAPKWRLAWEGRSELSDLSYWIWVCSKVLKCESRSEIVAKCSNILQDIVVVNSASS